MPRSCWQALLIVASTLFLSGASPAQSDSVPPPLTHYKGRQIAQTMHYRGAPWLIRDNREQQERCSLMLANLGVEPGMTVCDLGCGNGYYSLQLARMVGPKGRVLAVDIQPEMLKMLMQRAEDAKLSNIEPIRGELHDPHLPTGKVDIILLVDVYHEFSHPEHILKAMREALSDDGRIALLEYREEDPEVPIKPLHKMSKRQILKEFLPAGFKLVKEFDRLPWQHMMFFARDE